VRAGPKVEVTAAPLDLSDLPASGGDRVIAFVERFCSVPKGKGAKSRLRLRPWQQQLVRGLYAEPRPRQGLLSIPRGNGKSTLAAALGLYGLFGDDVEGAEVLLVASSEQQAGIVFRAARRMVELEPDLADRCQVFQNKLYVPATDSVLHPLPADSASLQGYNPSLAIVDELHVVTEPTWEAVTLAAGKRETSLTLAISTPAADLESVMYKLVEHGRAADDPSFYFHEFAAPDGCDLDDESAWHQANPALGDFLAIDALRTNRRTTREASFRRFRLGQWTTDVGGWLPPGAWSACGDPGRAIPDGADKLDATAIVAVTVDGTPHVDVVRLWEPPQHVPDYQVPILEVEDAIRQACLRWNVIEVVCDPFRWRRSMQVLADDGLPVVEFPQNPARMVPATAGLYQAISNQAVTHSADPDLARHVANCHVRTDYRGTQLRKASKSSERKIDLAIATVMAFDRASRYEPPAPVTAPGFINLEDYLDD
jgi:phage terminase large subunit-like protein